MKTTIDYSQKENWCKFPEITKDVDTFYIFATEYILGSFEEGAPDYGSLDNKEYDSSVMLAPREFLTILRMYSIASSAASYESYDIGELTDDHKWKHYTPRQFYAAIVEKRY